MNKYCGVVILYNPETDVLERIRNYSNILEKLFIVDNSTKSDEYIATKIKQFESVEYCHMNYNTGISYALNLAFAKGIKEGFDFVLTMDQDSIFNDKDIVYMINYIEKNDKNDIGIYAPNYSRLFYDYKKNKFVNSKPLYKINIVQKVNWAITSGSFVKINALKKIMPIDQNYFIGYVDIDLGIQMKIIGYATLIIGNAILYQQIGGKIKNSTLAQFLRFTNYSIPRYYYLIRNNFYFRKKYKDSFSLRFFGYKQLTKYLFKIVSSENNKIQKIKMAYLGYCDYKNGLMGKKETIS